jgi:hypothetical protein
MSTSVWKKGSVCLMLVFVMSAAGSSLAGGFAAYAVADDPPPAPAPPRPEAIVPGQPGLPEPAVGVGQSPGPGAEPGQQEGFFPPYPWRPLLRYLRERRPELADRLERLRDRDPEGFRRVILDAFMLRLEEALAQEEARPGLSGRQPRAPEQGRAQFPPGAGGPPGRGPVGPEGPAGGPLPPVPDEFFPRVQELQKRHEQLEMRSRELAERLRAGRVEPVSPEDRERLRAELERTVNEQFEVRTELRRIDLERIERELQRLHERVESLRRELERRERERGGIIERRIQQLLGDEGGW